MYLVEKKYHRVDRLQYKIIITKYLNIAFHHTRACTRGCSKKWRLHYISQQMWRTSFLCSTLELVN
jgi:hypothetical protein